MENNNTTILKIRKIVWEFLHFVFTTTGAMAILLPVLFLLISIPLQFSPQNNEMAVSMRTLQSVLLFTGSGGAIGFLIGCGVGFVLYIFPALFKPKKEKSDAGDEIVS